MNIVILVPTIVLGILGGILGAIFTRLNNAIAILRKKFVSSIPYPRAQKIVRIAETVILVVSV